MNWNHRVHWNIRLGMEYKKKCNRQFDNLEDIRAGLRGDAELSYMLPFLSVDEIRLALSHWLRAGTLPPYPAPNEGEGLREYFQRVSPHDAASELSTIGQIISAKE